MTAQAVQAEPVKPGAPERTRLVELAQPPAAAAVKKPVKLRVERLERVGDWALLKATMVGADGRPLDYADTPLAEAAEQGAVSTLFVALFRRDGETWKLAAQSVGPTGVAWETWDADYGAPKALLRP